MSWASHPTSEMPESLASAGRHRRRRGRILGIGAAIGLLVLAVTGATLSPVLLGWPASTGPTSALAASGAAATATAASTEQPAAQPAPGVATALPASSSMTATPSEREVTPSVPSATTAALAGEFEILAGQVIARANEERARTGCPALRADARLAAAAAAHTMEMAFRQQLTHTGVNGSEPGERIRKAGYDLAGGWAENVAAGYPTPEAVMTGWMKSKGHRDNILNCSLKATGVGVAQAANGELYWTQDFGGR